MYSPVPRKTRVPPTPIKRCSDLIVTTTPNRSDSGAWRWRRVTWNRRLGGALLNTDLLPESNQVVGRAKSDKELKDARHLEREVVRRFIRGRRKELIERRSRAP